MKNERYIWGFVVLVLAVMLLLKTCNNGSDNPAGIVSYVTEVKTDTIYGSSAVKTIPQPYAVHDTLNVRDTIIKVDTVTIERIKEKLVKADIPTFFYPDTLRMGPLGYVAVQDSVQGLITSRAFDWKIFQTNTITKEITPAKRRLKLFLGVEYMYPVNYIGAGGILQFKNDNMLKIGYGYGNEKQQYSAGYYFKIKIK